MDPRVEWTWQKGHSLTLPGVELRHAALMIFRNNVANRTHGWACRCNSFVDPCERPDGTLSEKNL